MCKTKLRKYISLFIAFLLGVSIILYPYNVIAQEPDFIQGIQRTFDNLIQQIKQGIDSNTKSNPNNVKVNNPSRLNQPVLNNNNALRLTIDVNKTKTTSEIYMNQPSINLTCRTIKGCNLQIKVQHKQTTLDNYTSFETLEDETIKLNVNTSTQVIIKSQKGPFLISIKNLGTKQVEVDYSIQELVKAPVSTPSVINNQPPNITTTLPNMKDLGRIMFQKGKDDSYVFLITQELNKGKYRFHIIPSSKRNQLIIVPLENGINISINLQDEKGVVQPIYSLKSEVIYMSNPLTNNKGIIIIDLDIKQDRSRVSVIGI